MIRKRDVELHMNLEGNAIEEYYWKRIALIRRAVRTLKQTLKLLLSSYMPQIKTRDPRTPSPPPAIPPSIEGIKLVPVNASGITSTISNGTFGRMPIFVQRRREITMIVKRMIRPSWWKYHEKIRLRSISDLEFVQLRGYIEYATGRWVTLSVFGIVKYAEKSIWILSSVFGIVWNCQTQIIAVYEDIQHLFSCIFCPVEKINSNNTRTHLSHYAILQEWPKTCGRCLYESKAMSTWGWNSIRVEISTGDFNTFPHR